MVHGEIQARNMFLKASEVGRYPTIVLGDLDRCEGKWELNDEDDFREKQQLDLRQILVS